MDIQLGGDEELCGGTTAVFFPKMPGVDIQLLNVTPRTQKNSQERPSIYELLGFARITDIKCVLLFGFYTGINVPSAPQILPKLQKSFRETCSWEPVIAGGMVDGLEARPDLSKLHHVNGMVFSGPNVQAASIVLDIEVDTKESVKQSLQKLKNVGLSEKNSIAFMFGYKYSLTRNHKQENAESIAFQEVFPNTPLFGFVGPSSGLIGCDNFACGKANLKGEDSIVSPATVFCLLSFGQAT